MREDLRPQTFDTKLIRISEECAELIKAICKYQRFGQIAKDPKTGIEYDNFKDIQLEIADVTDAIGYLFEENVGPDPKFITEQCQTIH